VNHRACEMLSYGRNQLLNMAIISLHPEDELAKSKEAFQNTGEKGANRFETRYKKKDGTKIFVDICSSIIDKDKGIIQGIVRDITERKQAEQALADEAVRRCILVDQSSDGIVVLDQDGKVYETNKRFAEMLGYTPEEVLQLHVWEWDTQWTREQLLEMVRQVDEAGDHFETRHRRKDGTFYDVEISTNGAVCGGQKLVFCVCRDITERKRAEEALRESEEKFRVITSNTPDHIIMQDSDLRYKVVINPQLGLTEADIIGKTDRDFLGREDAEKLTALKRKVLETGESLKLETTLPNLKGENEFFEGFYVPKFDSTGKIDGLIGYFRNITERKQLEEERAKAAKLESIGLLAGGIAHDFNNILSVILGNVSLTKMMIANMMIAKEEKSSASESLIDAEAACGRARDLTMQLLTFSKGGTPVKKTTSISGLIKEASGFALRGSNVQCRHYLAKDLWPCEVDEGQISQVIHNLLINAVQAMSEGGTINIRVDNVTVGKEERLPLNEGRYVKLTLKDQGIGISKEHLAKIFDPYFSTKQKGSGLGLATIYSIIKRHGGYITVESELKVGTTFIIYLPASWEQVEEKEVVKKEIAVTSGKILVMDDEQSVRDVVSRMLEHIGHEVECANNGTQAVKIYKQAQDSGQPFDAVILDLTIPGGMGGKEAIKRLLKIDPDVKAIVSSGYSNDPVLASHRDYGFSSVVSKPYRVEELREVLQSLMKKNSG
ncbi:PAS domain S-box protein, partial [Gemmatimonadota bacterium]